MTLRGRSLVQIVLLACGVLGGCASLGDRGASGADASRLAAIGFTASDLGFAPPGTPAPRARVTIDDKETEGRGVLHTVLLYIPNRIFDVLDIVRLRLRVGPGVAFGIRATEFADIYLGSYGSIFIGIPGPRGEPAINWPFGLESNTGIEVSVADATTGAGASPNYGAFEFGVGGHLLLVGLDIGIDPWEIVDFVTGLLTIDPVHDDL